MNSLKYKFFNLLMLVMCTFISIKTTSKFSATTIKITQKQKWNKRKCLDLKEVKVYGIIEGEFTLKLFLFC